LRADGAVAEIPTIGDDSDWFVVGCSKCRAVLAGALYDREEAIAAWNQRVKENRHDN